MTTIVLYVDNSEDLYPSSKYDTEILEGGFVSIAREGTTSQYVSKFVPWHRIYSIIVKVTNYGY